MKEGQSLTPKGLDGITLWPVHCVSAAVLGSTHTQAQLSLPGPTNMQDRKWTQIFQ